MKSLNTIIKKRFIEYLNGINVKCNNSMKLGELIELTKKCNDSNPRIAIGTITELAIKEYEEQSK